jgi:diacylglycerol kinase (ATP)
MSLVFKVSRHEGLMITIAVGFVWIAEMFNTCIEKTMDFISTEKHPEIKSIKDIAAGAVLIASVTAFIIGLTIFIPKIL